MLLTGSFQRSLDEKLRFAIPKRIRDALGGLDYRIVELESQPLGQRFTVSNRRGGQDLTGEAEATLEVIGIVADGRYADVMERAL